MKFVKLSLLVMAIVGQTAATGGGHGSGAANYGSSSISYGGGGTSSASIRGVSSVNYGGGGTATNIGGGSSVNYGGSNSFTSSGYRETTSSKSYGGTFSGGYGQNEAPKPFNFDYNSADEQGNTHYHSQEADASGTVRGSYGYTDIQGLYRVVDYVADASGFRASIRTNEPGTDGKESPADVQMTVDQPPAGIQDRYTTYSGTGRFKGTGGPRVFTPSIATGENKRFGISPKPVKYPDVQVRPPTFPQVATVVRQTYKPQYVSDPGTKRSPQSNDKDYD